MRAAVLGVIAMIAAVPEALAQDVDGPGGGEIAEELRRMGDQMGAIARGNENLYWISIGIGVASVGAVGGVTLYLIRRQLGHMDRDAEVRRRPILSQSKLENGKMYNMQKTDQGDVLTIRLVNVGHIAALSIKYDIKTTGGDGANPLDTKPVSIGSLAPNAHTELPVMLFQKGHEFGQDGSHVLRVVLRYESIEKKRLTTTMTIAYDNDQVGIREEHG
ncbi:MAG: hypothetical protein OXU25_00710 [Thaumarchaeota archaeon]|nr:hypothetical protein [Nitrososphaerota archaeon]